MSKPPRIKQEKQTQQEEDKELAEWARKLVENKGTPGQPNTNAPLAAIFTPQTPAEPPHSGFDRDSSIGRFSWAIIGDGEEKCVPCVFRNNEEFVAIRMAEASVIGQLLNVLPSELYDSAKITSYYTTTAESKLLSYVNQWHCDGFYGPEPFTNLDLVISLKDLRTFHDFLLFSFNILHSGGKNLNSDFSRCGFVHVNGSLIPYTVLDEEEKGVPLFYFEGQTDILKVKSKSLGGWPLSYLKVCCKVQGVRKDLISNPTLQIVTLADLQAYFPKRTAFTENCWPSPKPKSLLPKQVLNNAMLSPNLSVDCNKWTKVEPNEGFPNFTTSSKTNTTNTSTISTVVMNPKNGTPNVTLSCNGVPTNYQIPKTVQLRSPALTKVKISTPPIDKSRLIQIPEHPNGGKDGAYVIRLIVFDNQFMHCINSKPGMSDEYLVVLQEFMQAFFPLVSIYPTAVSVLRSADILTYLPNSAQIKTLNNFGFQIQDSWQVPLIPATEAQSSMSKLRVLFKHRPVSSNLPPPVTASKVSNGGNAYYQQRTYNRR